MKSLGNSGSFSKFYVHTATSVPYQWYWGVWPPQPATPTPLLKKFQNFLAPPSVGVAWHAIPLSIWHKLASI